MPDPTAGRLFATGKSTSSPHLKVVFALIATVSTLLELALYVGLGTLAVRHWEWRVYVAVLVALLIAPAARLLIVLVTHTISSTFAARRPPELWLETKHWLSMIGLEFWSTLVLFGGLAPLEPWLGLRAPKGATPHGQPPVLCIHGYLCNGSYWWSMIRYLRRRGFTNLYTISLVPVFGSIECYVDQVARRIDEVLELSGADRVIILAHSMGGLAARCYLAAEPNRNRVEKIITLASPHHGTLIARLSPTKNSRQMRPESSFIDELNRSPSQERSAPITSIFSVDDNIVVPQDSSRLEHAQNIAVAGVGHVAMAFSPTVKRLVYQQLSR